MFRKLCDASGVTRIIAVATEAVRRAKNQRSFLDEIQATCGIKIKVLTSEEEAILVYRGVINTMDIPKGIVLEIGGGSTKIVYYNRRNMLNYVTLPFGAVTLTGLFSGDGLKPDEQAAKIEEFFTEQLKRVEWLREIDPDVQMIGVGGSFRNLFKITKMVHKYPLDNVHNYKMAVEDFIPVYDMIKVLDLDKKKKIKGLSLYEHREFYVLGRGTQRGNYVQSGASDDFGKAHCGRSQLFSYDPCQILRLRRKARGARG